MQLSVRYSESCKVYLHRSANAQFPTDDLLFLVSLDVASFSSPGHITDRRFEFQLNGCSTATIVAIRFQPGIGMVFCKPNGEGSLRRFDRKWRRNGTTSSELFAAFKVAVAIGRNKSLVNLK